MKFAATIFSLLTIVFLLCSLSIFVSGLFIFLSIELYAGINEIYGLWAAYIITVLEAILFYFLAIKAIKKNFLNLFIKTSDNNESASFKKRQAIISLVLYELLLTALKKVRNYN